MLFSAILANFTDNYLNKKIIQKPPKIGLLANFTILIPELILFFYNYSASWLAHFNNKNILVSTRIHNNFRLRIRS